MLFLIETESWFRVAMSAHDDETLDQTLDSQHISRAFTAWLQIEALPVFPSSLLTRPSSTPVPTEAIRTLVNEAILHVSDLQAYGLPQECIREAETRERKKEKVPCILFLPDLLNRL